jgi:hypothetical protein
VQKAKQLHITSDESADEEQQRKALEKVAGAAVMRKPKSNIDSNIIL